MTARRASVLVPLSLSLTLVAGLVGWKLMAASDTAAAGTSDAAFSGGSAVSASDLEVAMIRAGLTPQALCAAGVSNNETQAVVSATRDWLLAHQSSLAEADATYAAMRTQHDAEERKVQSGLATVQEVSTFQGTKTALAQSTAARASALDAIFAAGIANLSSEKRALVTTIRTNAASWNGQVETAYLSVERSEAQWVELRSALAAKRVALQEGEEVPADSAALIATADQNATVSTAKANLQSNLASLTTAWKAATIQ